MEFCESKTDVYIMAQTVKRDTALATAAVYQEMLGESDGTVPATYQVLLLYPRYYYYTIIQGT